MTKKVSIREPNVDAIQYVDTQASTLAKLVRFVGIENSFVWHPTTLAFFLKPMEMFSPPG